MISQPPDRLTIRARGLKKSYGDVTALDESYITITPLQFALTDHARMEAMKQWEWKVE